MEGRSLCAFLDSLGYRSQLQRVGFLGIILQFRLDTGFGAAWKLVLLTR